MKKFFFCRSLQNVKCIYRFLKQREVFQAFIFCALTYNETIITYNRGLIAHLNPPLNQRHRQSRDESGGRVHSWWGFWLPAHRLVLVHWVFGHSWDKLAWSESHRDSVGYFREEDETTAQQSRRPEGCYVLSNLDAAVHAKAAAARYRIKMKLVFGSLTSKIKTWDILSEWIPAIYWFHDICEM